MNNKLLTAVVGIFLLGLIGPNYLYFSGYSAAFAGEGIIFNPSMTHLESVEVNKTVKVLDLRDIRQALEEAKAKGLKISIAGARHAQGGQQSYPNCIVLDMMGFNKIISLDKPHKIIRVQSGATWKQVQDYIQSYGYTVRVMQTSNIFTVGGSLSSNIHGKDMNYGSIIETVKSFHFMLADGRVINVSRQENPELFSLVIGGYGLFGIIIDVDLLLTDNVVYKMITAFIDYRKYPGFFQTNILNNTHIGWMEAYFLGSKQGYLKTLKVTAYSKVPGDDNTREGLSADQRKEYVSRADLMAKTFKYKGQDQIILQEYFVPINKFVFFIDGLREIFESKHAINAKVNVIRYIKEDKQSFLPYAKVDSFSLEVVIHMGQSLSPHEFKDTQDWIRRVVDLSLSCGGTFYLTKIAVYPAREQLLKAYPEFIEFIKKKKSTTLKRYL